MPRLAMYCECGHQLYSKTEWEKEYEKDSKEWEQDIIDAGKNFGVMGLEDSDRFARAYRRNPILSGITGGCFLGIFLSAIGAILYFIAGKVFYAVVYLILVPVLYLLWKTLNNILITQEPRTPK
jgi:hypothetical protein